MTTLDPDLIHDAADRVADAVVGLIDKCGDHFTCQEADAFANLLRAVGRPDDAADFLRWHAGDDDERDDHWGLNPASTRDQAEGDDR